MPSLSLCLCCPFLPSAQPRPQHELRQPQKHPQLTSHSQEDRKEQKAPGGLWGPHGGQTCTGHHSPGAGGPWCDVQPSEGGSLRWVVAAGGGDSSRGEGRIDMAAESMQPRGLCHGPNGLNVKDKRYTRQFLIFISRGRANPVTGGTTGVNN